VQVVKVEKYGISYELPKGWITIDAKKVLEGGGKNPVMDDLVHRLGIPRDQLVRQFSSVVQTMSVSDGGAVDGFLANVNSVGQEGDVNDEQLKLQLATIGAKASEPEHETTDAGNVTRVAYFLATKVGITIHAVVLAVHTRTATVAVTVAAITAQKAAELADTIEASLKPIPGSGPNL